MLVGHFVRSRAEALVDNWFYSQGIAHAYEQRLPGGTEAYSDFYLPTCNVYKGIGIWKITLNYEEKRNW